MTTQTTLAQPHSEDYSRIQPLPDPPREPDMVQRKSLSTIDGTLGPHFVALDDVLLTGEMYVRIDEEDARALAPDFIFARQVSDPERVIRRNGYVISEVGKPPDLVLEVGSRNTGRRDYTVKREGYAALGIREYWRFDPSGGEYHDRPLAGDALVDGEYVPVEIVVEADGRHRGYSEILELELWWEEGTLRFRDPASGQFLLTPEELEADRFAERAAREAAEARAQEEEAARGTAESRAGAAESRAEEEEAARLAAQARAETAEVRAEEEEAARLAAEARAEEERAARLAAESRLAEFEAELRRLRGE